MIDLADELMDVAKERFKSYSNFNYIVADYTQYKFEQKYDIIVSALSIHHLAHQDKRRLYEKCYAILNDDGCFINADQVLSPSEHIEKVNLEAFKSHHRGTSLSEKDCEMAYARMRYDNPSTLFDQLQWLSDAKFRFVDCIYKHHQFCVIYAQK